MILVSGMIYGTGKIARAAEHSRERKLAETQQTQQFGAMDSLLAAARLKIPGEEQPGGSQSGGSQPDDIQSGMDQPDAQPDGTQSEIKQPNDAEPGGNQPGDSLADDTEKSQKKREFRRVEMDYLNDALFIGDSRTSTLYEYAGWEQTDFFVKYGLTIWDVWDQEMNGRKLEDMLGAKKYGKIYIMLGINELGNETAEKFREVYGEVLAKLHQLQPDAVIFLQAIVHVSARKDAEGTYINNAEVNARNQEIKTLADNDTIIWLDPNEVMDEPGAGVLRSDYTGDGVHLKVKYIPVWREFLLDHGV